MIDHNECRNMGDKTDHDEVINGGDSIHNDQPMKGKIQWLMMSQLSVDAKDHVEPIKLRIR